MWQFLCVYFLTFLKKDCDKKGYSWEVICHTWKFVMFKGIWCILVCNIFYKKFKLSTPGLWWISNGPTFFAKLIFSRQNLFWYFGKGTSLWTKKKFGGKKINLAKKFFNLAKTIFPLLICKIRKHSVWGIRSWIKKIQARPWPEQQKY